MNKKQKKLFNNKTIQKQRQNYVLEIQMKKKLYEACLESQQALKLKVEEGQENELTACIKEVAKKTGLTDQQNYDEQMKCLNTKFLKPLSNKNYDYILFDCFAHPSSCLLYTSPSPRDRQKSRMPSSA
eukprot:TRINITY_DN27_c0_g1_i1.p5 TRINITY_DN27_c0_g1~~TRINITY_DN27_c0_g1_i1.p5  ORF type:complete len:128 (-),score=35.77 TRINITY_DN27_c0_g1_i1:46-429(-)